MIEYGSKNSTDSGGVSPHVGRNRLIAIVLGVLVITAVGFFVVRSLSPKNDTSSGDVSHEGVIASSSVRESDDDGDGSAPISDDAITMDDVQKSYDNLNTDLADTLEPTIYGFDNVDARVSLYGDGKHYVISVTGWLTNVGLNDGDYTMLPDLVINDVTLDKELTGGVVRKGGKSKFRYQWICEEVPDSFEVTFGKGSAHEDWTDPGSLVKVTEDMTLADVMDAQDPAATGATSFKTSESDEQVMAEAICHELAVMAKDGLTSNYIRNLGFRDGGVYSLIDCHFTYDGDTAKFVGSLRNNLYDPTPDIVEFNVVMWDDALVDSREFVVSSDKPLQPGERFPFEIELEGGAKLTHWDIYDIRGFG